MIVTASLPSNAVASILITMAIIDLSDDEHAALTAAARKMIWQLPGQVAAGDD